MNKQKIILAALVNSLGTAAYISVVVLLMTNGERLFGSAKGFFVGLAMLMLFVVSATIVGLLVLGRPGIWYLNGMKKEALFLLGSTVGWLFIFTLIAFWTLFRLK